MGVSSVDVTEPLAEISGNGDQVAGKAVPRLVVYVLGCFCVTVMGGGIILGSGPFASALISEGYVEPTAVSSIFVGAFQILTWGTVVAAHLLGRLGPRITALVGVCISLPGILTLAFLPKPAETLVVTLAYGAIGAGGNHIYLSTFHFAQLFPDRIGLADGVVAGLFNAAGLVLLVLTIPGATLHFIFTLWIFVAAAVFVLILFIYPDKEYTGNDIAVLSRPSLKHARNPLNCSEYVRNFRFLCNIRYFLFVFSFGTCSVVATWVNGVVISDLYTPADVPDWFIQFAQPVACNSTVLFTWIIGGLIDKLGFSVTGFIQGCMSTILSTLTLFRSSLPAAWLSLLFLNWTNAALYTQQFVFLHKVFHGAAFTTALIATLVVQGSMLFIASPGLTNAFPSVYTVPSTILLVWSAFLFMWPLAELMIFRKKDLEAAEENDDVIRSRSVLGSIIGPALAEPEAC